MFLEAPLEQSYLSYQFGWPSGKLQGEGWESQAHLGPDSNTLFDEQETHSSGKMTMARANFSPRFTELYGG